MPTQHLWIREEIYNKLKEEENMSALVNKLLEKHFEKHSKTDEQIIQEVKEKIKEEEDKEDDKVSQRERVIKKLTERKHRQPTEKEINDTIIFINKLQTKPKEIQE